MRDTEEYFIQIFVEILNKCQGLRVWKKNFKLYFRFDLVENFVSLIKHETN